MQRLLLPLVDSRGGMDYHKIPSFKNFSGAGRTMAVSSMTGYGRAEVTMAETAVTVEARSSNHRFLEVSIKLPRELTSMEPEVRRLLQSRFHRGRFDLVIAARGLRAADGRLRVNVPAARAYVARLRELAAEVDLPGDVTLPMVLQCPDVLTAEEEPLPGEVGALFHTALDQALRALGVMRRTEGENLRAELSRHLQTLEESIETIEKRLPEVLERYRERLRERIRELTEGLSLSEERLATEVALLAEKSDVAEELLRLRSHLGQFREQLESSGPVGRSLDFLVQEMQREVNTIGAKAGDLEVTRLTLVAKGAVEKLREQVQNIE